MKKLGDFHYLYNEIVDDSKKVLVDAIKEISKNYVISRSEYQTDSRLGYNTARVVFGQNVYFTLSYGMLDSGKDYERVMFITLPGDRRYSAPNKNVLFGLLDGMKVPRKKDIKESDKSTISRYLHKD